MAVWLDSGTCFGKDAADTQMARTLGTEGLRLAEAGDCTGAVDKLSRAEKLRHAPTTLERLGECQIALGHYVEGTENLRSVVRERLERSAPPAFVTAKARAQKALDAALPHVGKLRVDVTGPVAGDVALKIDDQPVSSASLGVDRPIDPGTHVVEATAPGYKGASAKVDIERPGASRRRPHLLGWNREAVVPHEPTTTTVSHRVYWPAAVAFGVAGASAILTAVFGSLALAKKNDLVAACGVGRELSALATGHLQRRVRVRVGRQRRSRHRGRCGRGGGRRVLVFVAARSTR